jgi:predicted dehydrogenase
LETLVRTPDQLPRSGVPELPAGHPEGWGEALCDLLRPFYAAVARDEEPLSVAAEADYPTLIDGARAVRFVEAVLASTREQRWVSLAEAKPTSPT